jgi:succinate dehydrogenase flavin-adding protein (antitoxin of CptAB toxin-antitoxin module)
MAYKVNYGPSGTTLIQVGTKFYLVYESEGKKLYWEVNKNELKNIVDAKNVSFDENGIISTDIEGFQYITPGTWSGLQERGEVWYAGLLTEIQDNEFEIDNAVTAIKRANQELPWSNDEDYLNLITEYLIEDKENWTTNLDLDPEGRFEAVLAKYDFDKNMYNRLMTYKNNEIGRLKLVEDSVTKVKNTLRTLEANLDEDTIDWVANKYASASWSDTKLLTQLTAATQRYSIHEVDDEFKKILEEGVTTFSNKGVEEMTKIIETYLPKELQQPYLDDIQNLAGKYLSDATFAETFTEQLKDERFAFNPNWDREIPWANVKKNAMTLVASVWGVTPDETDTTLVQIMGINDTSKQLEIARREGIDRGYAKPTNDLYGAMSKSFGTGVVKSLDYELNKGG